MFKEHLSLIRTVILELGGSDVHVPGRKETVAKAQTQEETRKSHLDKHPRSYTEPKKFMCWHTSRKAQVRTHECEDDFKTIILKKDTGFQSYFLQKCEANIPLNLTFYI